MTRSRENGQLRNFLKKKNFGTHLQPVTFESISFLVIRPKKKTNSAPSLKTKINRRYNFRFQPKEKTGLIPRLMPLDEIFI